MVPGHISEDRARSDYLKGEFALQLRAAVDLTLIYVKVFYLRGFILPYPHRIPCDLPQFT